MAFTTYYYRIRPSNATTTGISQVVTIRTPACHPSYAYACIFPVGLSSLTINNVLLSQNSGCSPNGYGVFYNPTNVVAGITYPISGTFLYPPYPQGVTIWADLNRDGVFTTSQGELLFQTPYTVTGLFSGSLTLPTSLPTGALSIRVVTIYDAIPNDPCGAYSYGETEDYLLNIVNPPVADLSLSLQTSSRIININQPVSYSLTLRNDGPDKATGISWQNRLPSSVSFVSGDAGIVNSGTAVSSSNLSLVSGSSATFIYKLQPTQPGTFINAAQILLSDQLDPDSQPGSGTGDGQDDEASVDIRTVPTNGTIYNSPNPNQTPLPSVLSDQPTPDPAKADLSLAMVISSRTPIVGQPVTVTITLSNAGGLTASSIVVRDTLRALTFSSSPTGMSVVSTGSGYTIIEGSVASLTANGSAQLVFVAMTAASGYLRNAAQVWSSGTPDPDSSPGSLTPTANNLNGEDDVAQIDLRVGLP